jgi:hypothetical protein
MSFYMPYGTGKKPTKHTDATVRVLLAKFKCANVLAAFQWRSENVPSFFAWIMIGSALATPFRTPQSVDKTGGAGSPPITAEVPKTIEAAPVDGL